MREDVSRGEPVSGQGHATLHSDELSIDTDLVARLIERDVPEFAGLALKPLACSGSSNALFRLGQDLLVRLPRQPGGGESIAKEARWSPTMAAALPIAIPEIVAVGQPGFGYPEQWSLTRWIEGDHPPCVRPEDPPAVGRSRLGEDLADVVLALRAMDVPHLITDELRWYRGDALSNFDDAVREYLRLCRSIDDLDLDLDKAEALWDESLRLPGAAEPAPDRWYHGDLVAENLLLADGRLAAVLDFGSVSIGDPTIDLHGAWEILDGSAREVFASKLGASEPEWLRGRAWALGIALGALSYYWHTMPGRRDDRIAMASNVLSD